MNFEHNLFELATQIHNRTYKVGKCVYFIVNNPVKREIFAADFKDRVVHHLVYNYVNHLFERTLIRDCYSCRKGFGTSDGIERIKHHMRSVTDNHSTAAYVLKLDIQGFFMSIDRKILFEKVERIVRSGKLGKEITDLSIYLLREIIFNDPTVNCLSKGDPKNWEGLPASKSLFYSPEGCGLPIGNLTSQIFSNVYLSDFDHYIKRILKVKHYGRYVDDIFFMHNDKQYLLDVRDKVTQHLKENYRLTVHPKKIYLQNISHGMVFLGAHIKPYRMYLRHRTLGQMRNAILTADRELLRFVNHTPDMPTLYRMRSIFNSYFGYASAFKTHNLRKKMWDRCKGFQKYFMCNTGFRKIAIKEGYRAVDAFNRENPPPLPPAPIFEKLFF